MPLLRLWPRLRFTFGRCRRLRKRRRPGRVSPGEGGGVGACRRASPSGRSPTPWPTNRARFRGFSIVLGSPTPSASSSSSSGRRGPPCRKFTVVRLPLRRVYPRRARAPRRPSQRPSQLVSHLLRQLTPGSTRGPPVSALRFAGRPSVISRRLPSLGLLSPPSSTPASDGAVLGPPGSVWVRAVTATPAAGAAAAAGGAGMAVAQAVATSAC